MTPSPISATRQGPVTVRVCTQRLGSTPRGARLARHVLVEALADRWEVLDRLPVGRTVVAERDLSG